MDKDFYIQQLKEDLDDLKRYIEEFLFFLPLPVCLVTPRGIIVDANRMFYEISGYRKEKEFYGEDVFKVEFLFGEKEKWQKLEKTILERGLIRNEEMSLITKTGKKIPIGLSASYRDDESGHFIGYFLAFWDITENKMLQENLEEKVRDRTKEVEEEKNKTLTIIKNFVDGLLVFDEKGVLSLINPRAENLFGVKSKEIAGMSLAELSGDPRLKPLTEILGGQTGEIFRKEFVLKENLVLEVSVSDVIREGKKAGNLVILHDVSREKLIEKMKTEFVSLAAHQLRTPLSAIKWILKMFLDGDLGSLDDEQKEFIESTYKSNERMISLVNDLLNVTRIEEGRYLYKIIAGNIEDAIQSVVDFYEKEAEKKKIRIVFDGPKVKTPQIMLDIERVKMAIGNILDNAIKYTPAKGKIIISLRSDKKEVKLSIKDSGAGIPESQQKRVFSKFFRGSNVISMETEGTGLGLFIAKNIIEAHNGRISFESKEGKGTTFYIVFPIETKV